jgi:hypothetical protein
MIQKIKFNMPMATRLKSVVTTPVVKGDSLSAWAANEPARILNKSAMTQACAKFLFSGNSTVVLSGGSK